MSFVARILDRAVWLYQKLTAGRPPSCRFDPSCSSYTRQALAAHGARRGSWLALRRLLRCHPWGGRGYDPVPGLDHSDSCDHSESRMNIHAGTSAAPPVAS